MDFVEALFFVFKLVTVLFFVATGVIFWALHFFDKVRS